MFSVFKVKKKNIFLFGELFFFAKNNEVKYFNVKNEYYFKFD